jgi:hypothetical protein
MTFVLSLGATSSEGEHASCDEAPTADVLQQVDVTAEKR